MTKGYESRGLTKAMLSYKLDIHHKEVKMVFQTNQFKIIAADTKPGLRRELDPKIIMKLYYLTHNYGKNIIYDSKNIHHKEVSVSLKQDPLTLFISKEFQLLNTGEHDVFFLENKMSVMLNKSISDHEISSFVSEMEMRFKINLNEIFERNKLGTLNTSMPKPKRFNFSNLLPRRKRK
ncbi:MAG: hypothetical protein GQ527_01475 [Bacteroidales bacterium]|nr:hypothetical protein [Bacteroidales bacterium]